jgi:hypothetical protein
MNYAFDFQYDFYPQEMILYVKSTFQEKQPFISIEWVTPDDRTIRIANLAISRNQTYRFSQDEKLKTKLRTDNVIPVLFSLPDATVPAKGRYQLLITGATFEPIQISTWNWLCMGRSLAWQVLIMPVVISWCRCCGVRQWHSPLV